MSIDLKVQDWKEFLLNKICKIEMGNKFDNDKMGHDNPSVNFVSRTANNNGVSDYVDYIEGVTPYPAGTLSVALGGSIGSCYLQAQPFYTGQNVCVLEFDDSISDLTKLFIASLFMNECKYKFVAFGRELNKHMKTDFSLFLPILKDENRNPVIDVKHKYSDDGYVPDWKFMENYFKQLHYKPITTSMSDNKLPSLDVDKWEEFIVGDLFPNIYKAKAHTKEEVLESENGMHFVSRTDTNNGIDILVNKDGVDGIEQGNCITVGDTTATCYYQNEEFIAGDHMVVLRAEWLNAFRGLFIRTLFAQEQYRYCYGRAYKKELIRNTILKLPIQRDDSGNPVVDAKHKYSKNGYIPDWEFMEEYINSLPYSDRI